MLLTSEDCFSDEPIRVTGIRLFHLCHIFLQRASTHPARKLAPSGARLFYFIHLVLLRINFDLSVEPDERLLPPPVTRRFLQTMPIVAERLSVDLRWGIAILSQPTPLLRWRKVGSWLVQAPEFLHALQQVTGVAWYTTGAWPEIWKSFWQATEQEYAARMFVYLHPERLRITPVASPNESPSSALKLLRECLRQDHIDGMHIPLTESFLYDEPLIDWILRPLLAETWIEQLAAMLIQRGAFSRG